MAFQASELEGHDARCDPRKDRVENGVVAVAGVVEAEMAQVAQHIPAKVAVDGECNE